MVAAAAGIVAARIASGPGTAKTAAECGGEVPPPTNLFPAVPLS